MTKCGDKIGDALEVMDRAKFIDMRKNRLRSHGPGFEPLIAKQGV